MNKPQKVILGFFIVVAIVIVSLIGIDFYNSAKPVDPDVCNPVSYKIDSEEVNLPSGIVFYYGITCPHCKIVEEFMEESNIEEKISISQREVYENATAAQEMMELQKAGKLPANYVGAVPLLYDNKTLYLGDKDIICILKQKAGID